MKTAPWLLIGLALGLFACEPKPQPPAFEIEITPKGAMAEGGAPIKFAMKKTGLDKSHYDYSHKVIVDGECKLIESEDKGYVVSYDVDGDCLGGKGTFNVTANSDQGETAKTVTFTLKQKLYPKEVLPPTLDRLPATWAVIDDFKDGGKDKKNPIGGLRDRWNYGGGVCKPKPGPDGSLQIDYKLAMNKSQCGFVEHLKVTSKEVKKRGKKKTEDTFGAMDLTPFSALTFQLKSVDGKNHKMQLEMVDFDPLSLNGQGQVYTSEEILVAKPYWRRYAFPIKDIPTGLKLKAIRTIGFKLDGHNGFGISGSFLIENLALVK
jgi:hypothetical protein